MAGVPDGAVAGEVGEELGHRDFGAVFGGEPGEAIGALSLQRRQATRTTT